VIEILASFEGGGSMRVLLAVVMLMSTAVAAHAQCNGRIGTTRPTKSWGTMQVCLDDKYSTCIQNNLKGGWTQQEAKARCDRLKAQGVVK
jgi:hypothetical protein